MLPAQTPADEIINVIIPIIAAAINVLISVSYTHLDVYKRQEHKDRSDKELWNGMNKKERSAWFKDYYLAPILVGIIRCV